MHPEVGSYSAIGQRPTKRHKLLTDFLVTKAELQLVLRREPVCAPGLRALTLPAYPATHQVPVVRIAIHVSGIEVEESVLKNLVWIGVIGEHSFHAKIQLGQSGEMREVQPRIKGRFAERSPQRRWLVISESVTIEGEPVSRSGHTVPEVESTARIAGV